MFLFPGNLRLKRKSFFILFLIIFFFLSSIIILWYSLETPYETAKMLNNKCGNNNHWNDCYAQELSGITTKNSPFFLTILKQLQTIDPKTNDCHYIAHKIAWKTVELRPDEPFSILRYVDSDECSGGFIHGAIEGLKRTNSDFVLSPEIVDEVCSAIQKQNSSFGSHENCYHGFGHIILVENNAGINQGLSFCKQLQPENQYSCFTGVFMESITRENLTAHDLQPPLLWNSDSTGNQIDICNSYSDRISKACWEEIAHMFIIGREYSLERSYSPCSLAKTSEAKKSCITHTSQLLIASPYLRSDQITSLCNPLTDNDYYDCLQATVNAGLLTSAFDQNPPRVKLLCRSLNIETQCRQWIEQLK